MEMFSFLLEEHLLEESKMLLQGARHHNDRLDSLIWRYDKNQQFSMVSFVLQVCGLSSSMDFTDYSTKGIWHSFSPLKAELLTWFAMLERLRTKERLCRLNIISQEESLCVFCNQEVESIQHLFFFCPKS